MLHIVWILLVILFGACVSTQPRDLGGFALTREGFAIQHSVRGRVHQIALQRLEETNSSDSDFQTLAVVETRFTKGEFLCFGPTIGQGDTDVVVLAVEDATHQHPVTRAWTADLNKGKLIPRSTQGLRCEVEECLD